MLRQKEVDAIWVKKNEENYYGYKSHINADQTHKMIHAYKVTSASLHDSQVFEELLDHTIDPHSRTKTLQTPENQKLDQELNTSSKPKLTWEVILPEQSDFFALR